MKQYEKIIDSGSELLVAVMSYYSDLILKNLNNQVLNNWDFLNDNEKYLAAGNINPSDDLYNQFESDMIAAHAEITDLSNQQVISETRVTITFADRIEFDPAILANLNPDQQKRIIHQAQVFTESIVLDMQGSVYITLENNYMLTKEMLRDALNVATDDFIEGIEKGKGAFVQSAGLVNDSRNDVFEEADIQVFQFWNPNDDRTTDLCGELHGTLFTADDPLYGFWTCPLHFGCRSTFLPIQRSVNEDIEGLPSFDSLSEKAQSQKQF